MGLNISVGCDLLSSSISDALRNLVPKAGGFARAPLVPNESKWHFESLFTLVALGRCDGCVVWGVSNEKIIKKSCVAAYFLTESVMMAEAFRPSLTLSPSPLVPTSSNSAACFLRIQLPPKDYWLFLKCRFLLELIRQQPACKDKAGYPGFLGLSLFGYLASLQHTLRALLETLHLVGPSLLCLWFQHDFRMVWERKKKGC